MLNLILLALFLQAEASGPDYKRNLWNLFSFRHSHSPPLARPTCPAAPAVDVLGLMSWLLFSSLVLMVAVWAGWSQRGKEKSPEQIMLADRKLDFMSGFEIMDSEFRMFIVEGVGGPGKSMDQFYQANVRTRPSDKKFKMLYNPQVRFKNRIYTDFNVSMKRIKLRDERLDNDSVSDITDLSQEDVLATSK